MLYRTEGIVLRSRELGEADRTLMIMTRDEGKVPVVARGARRPRNRFAGASQTFVHLAFLAIRGKGLDTLREAEIRQSFPRLRSDLARAAYAAYFAELVDQLVHEREPGTGVFALLERAFQLADAEPPTPALRHAFELRLLAATGYKPELDNCLECGQAPAGDAAHTALPSGMLGFLSVPGVVFHPERGGVFCAAHAPAGAQAISAAAWQAMRRLARLDGETARRMVLAPEVQRQVERAIEGHLVARIERPLKTRDFLAEVSEK